MTNPFTRFRQWRMERYYNEKLWIYEHSERMATFDIDIGEPCPSDEEVMQTARLNCLADTREHFNDHTFQLREKQ